MPITWPRSEKTGPPLFPGEIGAEYRAVMGRHFPAMAVVVVSGLLETHAKVEIEATAVLRRDGASV